MKTREVFLTSKSSFDLNEDVSFSLASDRNTVPPKYHILIGDVDNDPLEDSELVIASSLGSVAIFKGEVSAGPWAVVADLGMPLPPDAGGIGSEVGASGSGAGQAVGCHESFTTSALVLGRLMGAGKGNFLAAISASGYCALLDVRWTAELQLRRSQTGEAIEIYPFSKVTCPPNVTAAVIWEIVVEDRKMAGTNPAKYDDQQSQTTPSTVEQSCPAILVLGTSEGDIWFLEPVWSPASTEEGARLGDHPSLLCLETDDRHTSLHDADRNQNHNDKYLHSRRSNKAQSQAEMENDFGSGKQPPGPGSYEKKLESLKIMKCVHVQASVSGLALLQQASPHTRSNSSSTKVIVSLESGLVQEMTVNLINDNTYGVNRNWDVESQDASTCSDQEKKNVINYKSLANHNDARIEHSIHTILGDHLEHFYQAPLVATTTPDHGASSCGAGGTQQQGKVQPTSPVQPSSSDYTQHLSVASADGYTLWASFSTGVNDSDHQQMSFSNKTAHHNNGNNEKSSGKKRCGSNEMSVDWMVCTQESWQYLSCFRYPAPRLQDFIRQLAHCSYGERNGNLRTTGIQNLTELQKECLGPAAAAAAAATCSLAGRTRLWAGGGGGAAAAGAAAGAAGGGGDGGAAAAVAFEAGEAIFGAAASAAASVQGFAAGALSLRPGRPEPCLVYVVSAASCGEVVGGARRGLARRSFPPGSCSGNTTGRSTPLPPTENRDKSGPDSGARVGKEGSSHARMMGEVHIEVHEKVDEADALKPADVGGGETSGSGTAEQQQDPIGSNNGWTNTTPLDAAAARVVVFHSLFEHIGPLDAACAYECLPSALCAATNELTIKSDEESASAHNNEAQLATAPSANGHGEKEDNKIRCVVGSISKNNNRKMKQQQLLLKFLSPLQQQQKQQVSSLSSSSSVVKKDGDDMIK